MDLKYFNDLTNQDIQRYEPSLDGLSMQELVDAQRKISLEIQKRHALAKAEQQKKTDDFRSSEEMRNLKSEIEALQLEYSLLPKNIDLNQTVVLKLSAENLYESVVDIIENGDDPFGLKFEAEGTDSLPTDLKNLIEQMVEDVICDYNPATECLKNSFEGRRFVEFLQKLNGLEEKLKPLYDAGLDLDDLMEE